MIRTQYNGQPLLPPTPQEKDAAGKYADKRLVQFKSHNLTPTQNDPQIRAIITEYEDSLWGEKKKRAKYMWDAYSSKTLTWSDVRYMFFCIGLRANPTKAQLAVIK